MAKNDNKNNEKVESKLKQHKSSFKLKGIVQGIKGKNAYKSGNIEQGRYEGNEYASLRFRVTTSKNEEVENAPSVELFGMEQEEVFFYKYADKKKGEAKGHTKRVPWDEREEDQGKGYNLIGIRTNFDGEEETLVALEAVDKIRESLEDGDSVYVGGQVQYRKYEKKDGSTELQKQFVINSVKKYSEDKAIDFESEDFKEMASFQQEIVFIGANHSKDDGKTHVLAYVIGYNDTFEQVEFTIDPSRSKAVANIAKAFLKKFKFGDQLQVNGIIVNQAIKEEAPELTDSEDDLWGEKAEGYNGFAITNYINELQILGADQESYKKGLYKEEDFIVETFGEEEIDDEDEDDEDPFSSDEDEDEDLPFD